MDHTFKRGYTLIELIMAVVILGILGTIGAAFFQPLITMAFFTPAQLRTEQIGNQMVFDIYQGDSRAKGLRIMKKIKTATATSLTYLDNSSVEATLSWDGGTKRLSRTVNGVTQLLPLQAPNHSVLLDGVYPGTIFRYYDSSGMNLSPPVSTVANIARIKIDWVAYTGSSAITTYGTKYIIKTSFWAKQF